MKIMKKRFVILFFAALAAVCLCVGLSACASESDDVVRDSSGKQVPVYQGMVISSADTATTLSSDVKTYAGGASAPSPSAEATSPVTGDVNIEGVDIDTQIYVEGDDTLIEEEIEATFGVTGTGEAVYYADANEDILITVKFSNPDDFEILSFKINGSTYASYMFQDGSDMENIIIKLNVGAKAGFSEYTIDEIKYVDGTEIKDVLLNGDTTVKCGVRTDNLPYATVTNEIVTLDEISMDVKVTDLYSLISESDGYCMAVLFDGGEDTIYTEYLDVGTNSVTFSSLKANTVYQYAVFAVYDDLSGAGVSLKYLYTENFRTKNIVLFDDVEVTKTGVSFSYLWYEGYENATINHLSLESEGEIKLKSFDSGTTEIDGLLSNHNYTLTASYIGLDGSVESIHISFTTYAMETPEVKIDSLTSTKTDITYSVSVTDEDRVGHVSSVEISRGGEPVSSGLLLSGTVSSLLSDNEYTLTVIYTYDLKDGDGDHTLEVSKSVSTLAKVTPTVTIESLTSTKEEIEYTLSVSDEDCVGSITSVTLYKKGEPVSSSEILTGTISGLLSDNEYTLTVVYTYNLNDGNGNQTLEVSKSVSTQAKAVPVISFDTVTSSKTEISYTVSVTDEDELGSLTSVTVYHGDEALTSGTSLSGEFTGLLSNNKYTVVVEYTYDAKDGKGIQILVVSKDITTEALATPVVNIDLTSTKTGISYTLTVADEDKVGEITSVTLVGASGTSDAGTETSGTVENLLSDNAYTLTVVYTYDLNDGAEDRTLTASKSVSTLPMTTPVVSIESLTSTQTEINYSVAITDEDGVGNITSVVAAVGDSVVYGSEDGVITGLLSDNTYMVTIEYTYNLKDGNGDHTITLSQSIKTLAKTAPVAEIVLIDSDIESVTFGIIFTDNDDTGKMTFIGLYSGDELVDSIYGEFFGEVTYFDIEPYVLYTLRVYYEYDLNDGSGTQYGEVEMLVVNEAIVKLESVSVLNTSAVSEGETITVRADLYNPSNVAFTSAVINGVTYKVSDLSTSTRLLIEILYEDQFVGGDTILTLSGLTCVINGESYFMSIDTDNTASVFINGSLVVDDFSIVHFDDYGREEETEYAFKSEQLYYKITLENATGYDVYSVTVSGTVYSEDRIYMSDDKQTLYVAMSDTSTGAWYSRSLTSVSYKNSTIDKSKFVDFSTSYMRLKSDNIVEISTYEDLLAMNGWEYYKLVNNIDLSGKEWANINNYMYGVFDGNGYTISNVMAVATYENTALYLGLFYNMQGIVMNLDVCDVLYMVTLDNTTGNSYAVYAGGLAAQSGHVTIINCNISSSFQITNNGNGSIYVGAISGNGSSDTKLENVLCDMNAIVYYVSGYNCSGYLGNKTAIEISDCTCEYALTEDYVKTQYIITDGGYKFTCIDGEYTLIEYLGNDRNLVLPESINGNIYSIGDGAFYNSSNRNSIVSVIIPDGVTSVGYQAFYNCTSLESIIIPDSMTSIGGYAFYGCTSLTSITIPDNMTSIGDRAFYNCTSLTEINFNAVTMADLSSYNYVFSYAGKDGSGIIVTIGAEVARIPANLFNPSNSSSHAPNISSVIFEEGSQCESIGSYAFAYVNTITRIELPNSMATVGSYAFYYCTSLECVFIPESVVSIGSYAFQYCSSLLIVAETESEPSGWDSNWNYSGCLVLWGMSEIPTEDVTYTFVSNGGSLVDSVTAVWISRCPSTTREGYAFGSWYTDPDFSDDSRVSFPYCSSCDVTLYARWYYLDGITQSEGLEIVNGVIVGIGTCTDSVLVICMPVADSAFAYCTQITAIYLYDGCGSVGYRAFYDCKNLTTAYFYQTEMPELGTDIFGDTWDSSAFMLYVIESLYSQYQNVSDTYWQKYLVDKGKLGTI